MTLTTTTDTAHRQVATDDPRIEGDLPRGPQPGRPASRPRRRAVTAVVAVLAVVNALLLYQAWSANRATTESQQEARQAEDASTRLAQEQAVAVAELQRLGAELPGIQAEVDAQLAALTGATGQRDALRLQLQDVKAQLAGVEQRLDATFVQIVGQANVIEHLRGCFYGVNRSLNFAALGRDDDAAVALLEVALQCANAQAALVTINAPAG